MQGHDVSEETRQKLSKNYTPTGPLSIEVEETGHVVRSTWEEKIDRLLHGAVEDYEYEPERFDIGDRWYTPDFRIRDAIVEVKGYARDHDVQAAEAFMEEYPDYRYVVVGAELPADVHIPWEDRERLVDVV